MSFRIEHLVCNYQAEPIAVQEKHPPLSWQITGEGRGLVQTARRICVASSLKALEAGSADCWDTGWVESSRSVNIPYAGRELASDTDYFWQVSAKVNGETAVSEPARFTTALYEQSDWDMAYVGVHDQLGNEEWPCHVRYETRGYRFRHEYTLPKKVVRARAYFCGLGWGSLFINGEKVGSSVLDPAPTDYRKTVPYVVYDVTDRLVQGANAIGMEVGNGWYSEYKWPYAYASSPRAMLQLHLQYEDGTCGRISTDASWLFSYSPVLDNRMWGGEAYDARLEQPGWTSPGFDDSAWTSVRLVDRCEGLLKAQEMPPVRVMEHLPVQEILHTEQEGRTVRVFDAGRLVGGWAQIRLQGVRGAELTVRYSDRITAGKRVNQDFQMGLTAMRIPCTDTYILRGGEEETYEPGYTFHPLRYVEVEYRTGELELHHVQGQHTYSDLDYSTTFRCSNELYNKIHQAVLQALKNQMFGIPLDCLNREHWGWVDPASIAGTLYTRQHMPLFWKKWIADMRDAQFANGAVPDIAPLYMQNWHNPDPIWGGSYVRLVWCCYNYYDDLSFLADNYESMQRLFRYHACHRKNGILTEGHYGDHMMPGDRPGQEIFLSQETTYSYLWTGWYYECARTLARSAELLGRPEEAQQYRAAAAEIRDSVNEHWLREEGWYDKGSQTSQFYALAAGFVPEEKRQQVLDYAIREFLETYHGRHHTGNTGTTALLDVLGDTGRADLLHRMVNSTEYPGWGYMIANGATSIWESWSDCNEAGCELSMTMYVTIDEFFYNELCGVKGPGYFGDSLFLEPGYHLAAIAPYVPEDMTFACTDQQTVYGRLASGWQRTEKGVRYELSLPGNTGAVVKLAVPCGARVTEGGRALQPGALPQGILEWTEKDGTACIRVGSGSYCFEVVPG